MSHIAEKTSIYLDMNLKSLKFFEKASHHFEKASIPLKKPPFLLKCLRNASDF
jgi:hypothetical protein